MSNKCLERNLIIIMTGGNEMKDLQDALRMGWKYNVIIKLVV